jgi:hypothetical protein
MINNNSQNKPEFGPSEPMQDRQFEPTGDVLQEKEKSAGGDEGIDRFNRGENSGDVGNMPDTHEELEEEISADGNDIPDDEAENLSGKTFLDWMKELTEAGHELNGEDFAREFMLWYQSSDSYDDEIKKHEERKFQRWIDQTAQYEPSIFRKWYDKLKDPRWNKLGAGRSSFGSQRALSALLDKRASEIVGAQLPIEDQVDAYNRACKLNHHFEAQSFLMALAHVGYLTEQDVEKYYKTFGVKKEMMVYNGTKDGVGVPVYDEKGNVVTETGYISAKIDMWFETKLRHEAVSRGKRPDTWSSGRRVTVKNPFTGESSAAFRSGEWQAELTDEDMLSSVSRRGDIAFMTHILNNVSNENEVEATRALLEKKRDESPLHIASLKFEAQLLHDGQENSETNDKQKKSLEDKRKLLEKQIEEEEARVQEINYRLRMGINVGDFKSFLLDPTNYTSTITIKDKNGKDQTFTEADLAVSLTVRKYWQSRNETEAKSLVSGLHVKAVERQTYIKLMSDKFRREFAWSSRHHILGTRQEKKYDPYRDAALQISKFMDNPQEEKKTRNFSIESRNFRYDGRPGEKGKDIIAYHPQTGQAKRISIDNSLYPQTEFERIMFSVDDLIKKNLWEDLPDEKDPAFALENLSHHEIHYEPEADDKFMDILAEDVIRAREYLIKNNNGDIIGFLNNYQDKLHQQKKNLTDQLDLSGINGLNEEMANKLRSIVQSITNSLGEDNVLNPSEIIDQLTAQESMSEDLKAEITKEIHQFSTIVLQKYWRAEKNITILKKDYEESQRIANVNEEDLDREHPEIILEDVHEDISNIDKFLTNLSPQDRISLEELSPQQKQELTGLISDTSNKSLQGAYNELVQKRFILTMAENILRQEQTEDI